MDARVRKMDTRVKPAYDAENMTLAPPQRRRETTSRRMRPHYRTCACDQASKSCVQPGQSKRAYGRIFPIPDVRADGGRGLCAGRARLHADLQRLRRGELRAG